MQLLPHQPSLHGEAESTSLTKPVRRYLHIGWRRSVHIVGDDEISFEKGVCTVWARTLLVQAGLEGHMALSGEVEDLAQPGQGLPIVDLSPGCPGDRGTALTGRNPEAGPWVALPPPAHTGLLSTSLPWRSEALQRAVALSDSAFVFPCSAKSLVLGVQH